MSTETPKTLRRRSAGVKLMVALLAAALMVVLSLTLAPRVLGVSTALPGTEERRILEVLQQEPLLAAVEQSAEQRDFERSHQSDDAPACGLLAATSPARISRSWLLPEGTDETALLQELVATAEAHGWEPEENAGSMASDDEMVWSGVKLQERYYTVSFLIRGSEPSEDGSDVIGQLRLLLEDPADSFRASC